MRCEGARIVAGVLCAPYLRTRVPDLRGSPSLVTPSGRLAAFSGIAPRWHLFAACQPLACACSHRSSDPCRASGVHAGALARCLIPDAAVPPCGFLPPEGVKKLN